MKRYRFLHALIIALTMTAVARSQELRQVMSEQETRNEAVATRGELPAFDDDGGRVFIVKRAAAQIQDGLSYHGGAVISEPRQLNIFLGGGWADKSLRGREKSFSSLLQTAGGDTAQGALARYGVKNIFLPSQSIEQPFDFSIDQPVSDLRIQAVLSEMFNMGAVASPAPDAIYVVFLPPGLNSKLGLMIGGKHYAAYHNFFHAEQGEVYYVVVPFEPDVKVAQSVAARAVGEAAMNPTGEGWY
jgi:hypothetical protein